MSVLKMHARSDAVSAAPVGSPPPPTPYLVPKVDPAAIRSDTHWNNLSPSLRAEMQALFEEGRELEAIRVYWYSGAIELREAKERGLRWSASFPPKR